MTLEEAAWLAMRRRVQDRTYAVPVSTVKGTNPAAVMGLVKAVNRTTREVLRTTEFMRLW